MSIRHATGRIAAPLMFSPVQQRRIARRAANDNAFWIGHDPVLRDALKHFARHGLGAAEVACRNANDAFFAGDRPAYLHWLGICRALDRRMADAIAHHGDSESA